jgi:hypothetical protein
MDFRQHRKETVHHVSRPASRSRKLGHYRCFAREALGSGEHYRRQFHEGRAFVMEVVVIVILIIDLVFLFRGKG